MHKVIRKYVGLPLLACLLTLVSLSANTGNGQAGNS